MNGIRLSVCDSSENDKMNTNYINYFRAKRQKAQRKTRHKYLQTVVKVEICQKAAENGKTAATKKIYIKRASTTLTELGRRICVITPKQTYIARKEACKKDYRE